MDKQVLMCEPKYFFEGAPYYEINDWMKERRQIDFNLAQKQWEKLYRSYLAAGVKVNLIKPTIALPDMCFTANCGLVAGNAFLAGRFKNVERRPESLFFNEYFSKPLKKKEFKISPDEIYFQWDTVKLKVEEINPAANPNAFFEGQGDIVAVGEKLLIAGFGGQRTSREGAAWLEEMAAKAGISVLPVEVLPSKNEKSFYHLDTCLCRLEKTNSFLIYPDAFCPEDLKKLEKIGELIPVTREEAERLVCNLFFYESFAFGGFIGGRVAKILEKAGYLPVRHELTEFEKAGGSAKCLTFEY